MKTQTKNLVLTVEEIELIDHKDILASITVDLNDQLKIDVPVFPNQNGGDDYGEYPPYTILPFQYTNEDDDGNKEIYYRCHLTPQGGETQLESKNLWEDVRSAVLSIYLRVTGQYEDFFESQKNRVRAKDNYIYRGCSNCRYCESRLKVDQNEKKMTEENYRKYCALLDETIDDAYIKFLDDDQKTDKGLVSDKSKGSLVNKHKNDEGNYRVTTFKRKNKKNNMMQDEGFNCPYHKWHTKFDEDFVSERVRPFYPVDPHFEDNAEKDDTRNLEITLPYGVVIDFNSIADEVEDVKNDRNSDDYKKDNSTEEKTTNGGGSGFTMEMIDRRDEMSDEKARKVARMMGSGNELSGKALEQFVEAYVNLG